MRSNAATTINNEQPAPYHRAHLVISNQPHIQQQQLIQQHLQQKQQQQQQLMQTKDDGTTSNRKTSASSFFAAIRPRSKSDSVRRTNQKIQNHLLLSDRVI